ncbi:MAG: creatininase family protein, partial [Lentisphaeria bacterium]|nr:creatininase family protein [Lentisphaeria bacterium]NQZ69770.1 creatininase family protein [Lentisphaeria bacterium]
MAYVDKDSRSVDWQLNESGIVVWPIGAFEQHGYHMPLNTDNIQAEYFGKYLAKRLDAALLPALPFGTSLEHAGFRGSITLSPELMMGMVAHMADELEAQNFHTLIIMNGHGGNFSIAPKVREINRQDRPIKILIVRPWEHTTAFSGNEIHSGEFETSVLLEIEPKLVGDDRRD